MNNFDYSLLKPGALPMVKVNVPADEFDNLVRQWGVGFCSEWFGHQFISEFSTETVRVLQDRYRRSLDMEIGQ